MVLNVRSSYEKEILVIDFGEGDVPEVLSERAGATADDEGNVEDDCAQLLSLWSGPGDTLCKYDETYETNGDRRCSSR